MSVCANSCIFPLRLSLKSSGPFRLFTGTSCESLLLLTGTSLDGCGTNFWEKEGNSMSREHILYDAFTLTQTEIDKSGQSTSGICAVWTPHRSRCRSRSLLLRYLHFTKRNLDGVSHKCPRIRTVRCSGHLRGGGGLPGGVHPPMDRMIDPCENIINVLPFGLPSHFRAKIFWQQNRCPYNSLHPETYQRNINMSQMKSTLTAFTLHFNWDLLSLVVPVQDLVPISVYFIKFSSYIKCTQKRFHNQTLVSDSLESPW